MTISAAQAGILRDIAANKISLDDGVGDWLRDQLVELAMHEPQLIQTQGPAVILTTAGHKILRSELPSVRGTNDEDRT